MFVVEAELSGSAARLVRFTLKDQDLNTRAVPRMALSTRCECPEASAELPLLAIGQAVMTKAQLIYPAAAELTRKAAEYTVDGPALPLFEFPCATQ